MDVKLAIVIPYFKDHYIQETFDSLLRQSDKNFTLYIGDDASPISPIEKLKGLDVTVDYHYHRFEENLGGKSLVKQWERCLDLVQNEEWICILGDDDCISENFVSEFYAHLPKLEQNNANLLKFGVEKIDEQSQVIESKKPINAVTAAQAFENKFYGDGHSSLSEYIFRKEAYTKYGFRNYPLAWCSDDMAWLDFSEEKIIPFCKKAYVQFRLSPQSISGSKNDQKWEAKRQFFQDLVNEKSHLFPKKIQLKNLKRFEIFTVRTKKLKWRHVGFFFTRFLNLGRLDECFKFVIRFLINKLSQ
ncbi:MAG: glycosyltransferase [Flavobacteriaceae bacterium]|nr:glycosyltransferase [Flavobacteriaceae bacterium]